MRLSSILQLTLSVALASQLVLGLPLLQQRGGSSWDSSDEVLVRRSPAGKGARTTATGASNVLSPRPVTFIDYGELDSSPRLVTQNTHPNPRPVKKNTRRPVTIMHFPDPPPPPTQFSLATDRYVPQAVPEDSPTSKNPPSPPSPAPSVASGVTDIFAHSIAALPATTPDNADLPSLGSTVRRKGFWGRAQRLFCQKPPIQPVHRMDPRKRIDMSSEFP